MNTLFVIGVLYACAAAEPSGNAVDKGLQPLASSQGPVDVRVELEPAVIPFHRKARYSIVVEAPNDVDVQIPEMVDKFAGLATADVQRKTENLRGERRRIVETYTLDPIFIGDYPIEPASVTWGENESVTVPSPGLRVRDLTEEEKKAAAEFVEIAGPMPITNPMLRKWGISGAIIAVVALLTGVGVYLFLRWRKRSRPLPVPLLPWEVAYQRLRELDQRQLPQAGKYGPYYVDLSAILRYYIEDRFQLRAPEQTTPEFLAEAGRSRVVSDPHQKLLAGFLRHCDRVKFAQYVPVKEDMERSFTDVLQFIDETVPASESDAATATEMKFEKESAA